LGIFFLMIFSSFSYAASVVNQSNELPQFKVSIETIKDRIDFEENAQFKIIIENPRDTIETFNIKSAAPYVEWFIKTDPLSDYSVKVYPGTKKEVLLVVKPLSVGMGRYYLGVNIDNPRTKDSFKESVMVNVVSMSNLPAVGISGKVPEEIDPREPFVVTVWLENKNAKNLGDVTVSLKSDSIQESTKTSLGPIGSLDGTKTLEFTVALDKKTAPKSDSLRVMVDVKEDEEIYELKSIPYRFKILQYGSLVDQHNKKSYLFYSKDQISFVNDANVKFSGVAKIENPFYRALFTKSDVKPFSFVEDGKRYIGWNISLGSQEKFDVVIKINYWPFVVFVLAIVIILIAYYSLRSPIIVTKSVRDISTKDGGITRFKIVLYVKNRGKKTVENISIIDKIPDIADYEREPDMGTLQPVKVVHTKKGVIAKWIINSLGRAEETVITYKIRSRLSVLGGMSLPLALSKFYDIKGIPKRSYSNRVSIKV